MIPSAAARQALIAQPEVFADEDGVAINGYDPVAYFTDAAPVAGLAEHTFTWRDAE